MIYQGNKPISIQEFLLNLFGTASRSKVRKLLRHGSVRINGAVIRDPRLPVHNGDRVEYEKFNPSAGENPIPFPVLFEDKSLILVEKPAGVLTYGEKGSPGTSVYRILNDSLKQRPGIHEKIYVVHRLDREVGGLLLFAKSEEIQKQIKDHWAENDKKYAALVEGRPPQKSGTVKSWLKENRAMKVYSTEQSADAKLGITHYKTVKEINDFTLLEVKLETGRKNQIRVHLSDIGCPVAGDLKYGARQRTIKGIRLHGTFLRFRHPESGEWMEFESPLPRGFLSL